MMNSFNKFAVMCLPWVLVACGTIPTQPMDENKRPVVIDTPSEPVQQSPQEVPVDSAAKAPSAVIYLLTRAEQQVQNGEPEAAASSLERALRIAPRFSESYYRLGELRYQAGAYNQAISLAQKALRLGAEGILRRQAQDLVSKASAH
jgi:tetratricopeptide (TPR) repeat protein